MQEEHTTRLTSIEQRLKQAPDFPFDVNDLCNFSHSFDVLKKAIEFLSKQQRDQETLIVDLIDCMKTTPGSGVTEVVVPKDDKSNDDKSDHFSNAEPSKDWGPLMSDFDKRVDALERK